MQEQFKKPCYGPFHEGNILIIGCGGGYDIFCGLPLYYQYDCSPILANFSFSHLELLKRGHPLYADSDEDIVSGKSKNVFWEIDAGPEGLEMPSKEDFVHKVSGNQNIPDWLLTQLGITKSQFLHEYANMKGDDNDFYFPEYELSKVLGHPVYAFHGEEGGQAILNGLRVLIAKHKITTIIVVDGGTDSLMTGKELGLGTPHEDMLTLSAVNALCDDINRISGMESRSESRSRIKSYLYVLGYNIDIVHGVTDKSVQERILDLIREDNNIDYEDNQDNKHKGIHKGVHNEEIVRGFLGAYHLLNDPGSASRYQKTFLASRPQGSWINSLVCGSLMGMRMFDCPSWIKARGESKVPISPLMGLYWVFDLGCIVAQKQWDMKALAASTSDKEVETLIGF